SGRLIQRDYTSFYDYYAHGDGVSTDGEESSEGQLELPHGDQPVFHTDLGRKVYGGGGITPDVLVHPEEPPELVPLLDARTPLFECAVEYTDKHKIADRAWKPARDVLTEFEKWVVAQGMVDAPADIEKGLKDDKTRSALTERVRAEVMNATL